jgi:hypothetical protein
VDSGGNLIGLTGAAAGLVLGVLLHGAGLPVPVQGMLATVGLVALPVSMAAAVFKYRLFDIDRILSQTLAYAILTGLLVGVYAGLVLLATRVQRIVDRRFNRARHDSDRTLAAFSARLNEALDLDSVRDDLAGTVRTAPEPAHVSVWIAGDR